MSINDIVLPQHIGIIMDGNGRWATKRNKPRNFGHMKGADNVERVVTACFKKGVEYISLYAFSTENWKRPKEEVDNIMKIFKEYLEDAKNFKDENIKYIAPCHCCDLRAKIILAQYNEVQDICTGDIITI